MLIDRKVTELLDAFSSPDPTPGGGSAAALAGAVGVSLLAMVAGLPKTKTGAPEERAALDAARAELLALRRTLSDLVDRDAQSYDLVVAAFKRPKTTEVEKTARTQAIQDAMRIATEVPAETMRVLARALALAGVVATHGNPSAKSDLAAGVHLLTAALQGGFLNVAVNIGSIKDVSIADAILRDVKSTMERQANAAGEAFRAAGIWDLLKEMGARLDALT